MALLKKGRGIKRAYVKEKHEKDKKGEKRKGKEQ